MKIELEIDLKMENICELGDALRELQDKGVIRGCQRAKTNDTIVRRLRTMLIKFKNTITKRLKDDDNV